MADKCVEGRIAWAWLPFLLAPFLLPNIYEAPTFMSFMYIALALFAAAYMKQLSQMARNIHYISWLFLALFLLPCLILLLQHDINNPWIAWRQCLFIMAIWLVFAMSFEYAARLINSTAWANCIVIIAHIYILYALLNAFHLHFFEQAPDSLFLFWSNTVVNFPGPLQQRNFQGLFLVLTIILLWRKIQISPKQAWIWELASILPICGVFLTASRSALLLLITSSIFVWYFSTKRKQCFFSICLASILGALLSSYILYTLPSNQAGLNVIHRMLETESFPRLFIWDVSWQLFLQHPFFGIGWGNLPAHAIEGMVASVGAHPSLAPTSSTLHSFGHIWSHNVVLQFLAEGGFFGGLGILIVVCTLAKKGWFLLSSPSYADKNSHQITGWILSATILAHGMVSISLLQPFFLALFALFLAASLTPRGS